MVTAKHPQVTSARACRCVAALATWLIVVLASGPALAQGRPIALAGWVQWIAANRLMLILHDGPGVVPVDLTRVPLDQYQTLAPRDAVTVLGILTDDNRQVIGTALIRIPEAQAP